LLPEWDAKFVKSVAEDASRRERAAEMGRSSAAPLHTSGVTVELGRRYRFAASHRLHTPKLSEEENRRVFGKCSNPYGHGHNYILEISLSGEIDEATGMIANLADLDAFVEREVIEPFDHKSLNEDVPAFRDVVPTTENLCVEIYERLKKFPGAHLMRVRIHETSNNSFEYAGQ
jgi:6-pyruvoyltetrahydropterin/6-carboxytetrahydropterin synthase